MTLRECPDDHLRWQAFRYVADELDRDDRSAFEARLGDDPGACAAVAEAVELLGACLALDPPAEAGRRSRRVVVLAVALAAAAAVMLAILPHRGEQSGGVDADSNAGGKTIALERAWSHLQRSDLAVEAIEATGSNLDGWESELLADHSIPEVDEIEGADPPSWLMAAVALDGGAAEGDPGPLEN